jgi:hypothetical protein
LTDEQEKYPLGRFLEVLEDPTAQLTIDDVTAPDYAAQFVPSQEEIPNFGYTNSAYWLRFRIKNEHHGMPAWQLAIKKPDMESITLYLLSRDQQISAIKQAGDAFPFTDREVPHRQFIFKLPLPDESERTIYLRFATRTAMTLPLTLWSLEAFAQNDQREQLILGLYFGVMLIMAGYNGFLFFFLRDKSYLYYVSFIASFFLNRVSESGLASQYFWPHVKGVTGFVIVLSAILLMISGQRFTTTFLSTKTRTPRLHKVLLLWIGFAGLLLLLLPFERRFADTLMS